MLTFATERTVKNIFIICTHNYLFRINLITLLHVDQSNQAWVVKKLYIVNYSRLTTTLSIKPKSFAFSGVIKLSLSKAVFISSTDLPVCFE